MPEPLWINASGGAPAYSAAELRQAMALALMYGGRNMGGRQGVRPGGNQLLVSVAGSTITVQPGVLCIDPGLTTPQGPYWVAIPTAETPGPLAAADATNPRKDIVIVRVYDHDEDVSGLRLARTEYLAGTPGPTPARPATPAGAFRLATIDVPKSGTGSPVVTDERPYTVAPGGILPVRSQSERDALTAYESLAVYRLDTTPRRVEVYDGATWQLVPLDGGLGTVLNHAVTGNPIASSISSAEVIVTTTASVTFRAGRAYRLSVRGQVRSTVSQGFMPRVRKGTTLAAALLMEYGWMPPIPALSDSFFEVVYEFVNSTASDVSTQLAATVEALTTTQLDIKGFSTGRFQVRVEDIGPASKHPGLSSV